MAKIYQRLKMQVNCKMHFFEREKLYRMCKVIPLKYVTQRLKNLCHRLC